MVRKRFSSSRNAAPLLVALVAAPVLSAAGGEAPFRYGEDRAPTTLNPVFASTMVDTRMEGLFFEGLFTYDRFLNPTPALAARIDVDKSKTKATVFLRQGVWHDGKPITAEDVVFTVNALKDKKARASAAVYVKEIKSAVVKTPSSVEITFRRAQLQPERALMFKVLPKHKFGEGTLKRRSEFRLKPVGSGPYKVEKWDGTVLELDQNPHRQVGLPELHAKFIPAKKTQLDMLQYDSLECVVRVLPRHRPVVEGMSEKVALLPYESLSWWYLGLNHKNPHLQKKEVRRALIHALDRDELRRAHLGDGQTISGPFAPRSPFYNDRVKPYPPDRRAVSQLMRKAGYKKSGGVWARGGRKVRLRLTVSKAWGESYKDVLLDIQSRLKRAGFDVIPEQLEAGAFNQQVRGKRDFDMTLGAWSFDEGSNVYSLFHSKGRQNFFGYSSKRMDSLLVQSQKTRDPELYREIYRRVHEHAHNDLPYLFLWSIHGYSAMSTKVTGVDIHPFRFFTWVEGWKWKDRNQSP